jgi:hypothetical protein
MEQVTRDRLEQVCGGYIPEATEELHDSVSEAVLRAHGATYFAPEVLTLIHEIALLKEELAKLSKKASAKRAVART